MDFRQAGQVVCHVLDSESLAEDVKGLMSSIKFLFKYSCGCQEFDANFSFCSILSNLFCNLKLFF